MVSLLGVGAILVVVLILLAIMGVKIETDKGGTNVIKNVYIYLVLFATLMMTIGGSVGAFMAVADMVAPVPYHQTFEEFKQRFEKEANQPEEELKKQFEAMILMEKERQANRAKNNLIKSFGWIIIPLPVFIYFQRRLASEEI